METVKAKNRLAEVKGFLKWLFFSAVVILLINLEKFAPGRGLAIQSPQLLLFQEHMKELWH